MTRSMTAYGRAVKEVPLGRWSVEIHSVNRRGLEMHVTLPREFLRFDIEVRRWIAEVVQRGQITVRVAFTVEQRESLEAQISQLRRLKTGWETAAVELGFDPQQEVTLNFLAQQLTQLTTQLSEEEEEVASAKLKNAMHAALENFIAMKEKEGLALALDIRKRLKMIDEAKSEIEKSSPEVLRKQREKLEEKLREVSTSDEAMQERLLREVIILAEKSDVTEELIRLASHLRQFYELLDSSEKSVGRTLDFLTQEMAREINTLSTKFPNELTLTMKRELEKIREQVQNIE